MTTAAQAIKTSISRDERTTTKTRICQVLCAKYDVAVGIGWHRDKPHFDRVFGLSLGSACKFRFRRPAYTKWERFPLEARPRSIYMMAGPSRQD